MGTTWHDYAVHPTTNPWDLVMPANSTRLDWRFIHKPKTWLYCNYPEMLPDDARGDYDGPGGGHYINFGVVKGPAMIYASHSNHTGAPLYVGIRLHNRGTANVTVTPGQWGYRTDFGYCVIDVWQDFYNSAPGEAFTLKPSEERWLMVDKPVAARRVFNIAQQLATSGAVECYVYVYRDRAKIPATATLYPYDASSNQIRGTGNGTYLATPAPESRVLNVVAGARWHWFSNECPGGVAHNSNEIVAITDPGTKQVFDCSNYAGMIANFGLQYGYNLTLRSETPRTVNFFVAAGNYIHTNNYVRYGSSHGGGPLLAWNYDLTSNPENHARGNERWLFLTVDLQPGDDKEISFEHIMCGNSYAPVLLQIEAE